MSDTPDRVLTFERCFNFRDLGGYAGLDGRPVKWRHIFRGMTPQYMSNADALAVAELDISLVVDFRGDRFTSSGPVPRPGGKRIALNPQRNQSELERFRSLAPQEALPRVLETYGHQYATALRAMAEQPRANALFHCRLGKDRTGVFAALVLKLLGVGDDDVIQDYLITEQLEPKVRRLLEEVEGVIEDGALVAKAPPDRFAMLNVLQRLVSQYGGAYGYFAHFGVPASLLASFVEASLEPPLSSTVPTSANAQPAAGS
jgi:protein-tyrosine phosphatase